jgi:hypothetical protein
VKKSLIISMILLLSFSFNGTSSANFIINPGFESYSSVNPADFAAWTEGGSVNVNTYSEFVQEGHASAELKYDTGYLFQSFTITEGAYLNYGAWFRIITNSIASNWDQVQISLQIDNLGWTTIGGSLSNYVNEFIYNQAYSGYVSNWFLIADTVPISGLPMNAQININSQNLDTETTKVFVDNAFAQSVPEPSTLIVLGFGLLGLAGARRFKK